MLVESDFLPWHMTIFESLSSRMVQKKLPHALLFYGPKGVGKKHFSQKFIQLLLCENHSTDNCHCKGCKLFLAGTHPDWLLLQPEGASQTIKIDAIRAAVEFVQTSPLISRYKCVLIQSATTLNHFAMNALLKILEEPPANTIFILLCDDFIDLPATVTSRCQKIFFAKPEKTLALNWLNTVLSDHSEKDLKNGLTVASGAPLLAYDLLQTGHYAKQSDFYLDLIQVGLQKMDVVQLSEKWSDKKLIETVSLRECLNWFFLWLRGVYLFKITQKIIDLPLHSSPEFFQLIQKISQKKLLDDVAYLQKMMNWLNVSTSLNRQLVLDDLFIRWVQLCN